MYIPLATAAPAQQIVAALPAAPLAGIGNIFGNFPIDAAIPLVILLFMVFRR